MLNETILNQLKTHFSGLESKIRFVLRPSDHPRHSELWDMLESVASVSDKIHLESEGDESDIPEFSLSREGQATGITFRGIPGGHEFSSLILAVLHSDGKGKWPDQALKNRVAAIKGPVRIRTFISLSCTNCPDVVQALNQMALIHEDFSHTMVDGAFVPEEIESLGVLGVPAVFAGEKLVHSGKADFGEILSALESHFGSDPLELDTASSDPFDVVVVGGGPAGCASGIYSARKGLKTAIIAGRIGGQVNDTSAIANLISVPSTTGTELSSNLRKHAEDYDFHILENRNVRKVEAGELAAIHVAGGEVFQAKQVIIATGASWRRLGIPGEEEYIGKGVAFCPHCDGPFFAGKDVAVVGGGNSGVEAAIDLAGICSSVRLIEFQETLKADQVLVDKMLSLSNVTLMAGTKTTRILGDGKKVSSLEWERTNSGETGSLSLDGVFIQIGLLPNSQAVKDLVQINRFGEIEVDIHGRTSVPGIYAAGDVTTTPFKQIVIAMGEGAKASLSAFEDRMRGL